MNPHGRVPVLKDDQLVVWESHSILRYLAASYGAEQFWPASPAERSFSDRWMDWSLATLQPRFIKLFWSFYRTPENARNSNEIQMAADECDSCFRIMNDVLADSPYLGGENYSLADIPAGTSLYRYFEMGLDVPRHSNVVEWYSRLRGRPSFRRQIMVPFEELRGRLEF